MEDWDSESRHEITLLGEQASNGFLPPTPIVKNIPLKENNFSTIILLPYKNYARHNRSIIKYDPTVD